MGANRWKSADSWPLPNTQWSRYFLSGGDGQIDSRTGTLSTAAPGTSQAPDHYVYDPTDPPAPPSVGGHSCCGAKSGPQGPYDQIPVEQRSDVLVYTSDPLSSDTEVTGPTTVDLWASSSAIDTDFTAKLIVVKPDGDAINLNNGILRTSFRDSLSDPRPGVPDQPTSTTSRSGLRVTCSARATGSDWKSPVATTPPSLRRTRTPVTGLGRARRRCPRRRRSCTTQPIRRPS